MGLITLRDFDYYGCGKRTQTSQKVGMKYKLFEVYLTGRWEDYKACIKIVGDLDLIEHGIQFLCAKEDGASVRPGNNRLMDTSFGILLEMKEGTDVRELAMFFRALLTPFQHCLSLVKLCEDSQVWLDSCFEKKDTGKPTIITHGGLIMKKGTLTMLGPVNTEPVLKKKEEKFSVKKRRQSRWD